MKRLGKAFLCTAMISTLTLSTLAQGSAFTYQGRLNDGANPANGIYDLRFEIYEASNGGATTGRPLTNSAVAVSNGLFTVTLDFGAGVFPGANRWLGIGVRSNGSGEFTALLPRQPITATPYAIKAGGVTGPINGALITAGTITGTQLATGAVTAVNIASNTITAGQLAPGVVGFPELAKPYQSGRIPSSALQLGFGDYLLVTNFPTAFSTTPTLAFSVAQVGTIVGSPPQLFPLPAAPTNFAARIAQPLLTPTTVRTIGFSNGITSLSATKVLGRPAVVYTALACDLVEIQTCVTNFSLEGFGLCTVFGGDSNECYQAALTVECVGTGTFYPTNCSGGLRYAAAHNNAGNIWINSTITTNSAQFPSLALTALPFQRPMVAWYQTNSTSLFFSRASSADGSAWPPPVQVVNHGDVGRYCSLELVNGNPAISYYNTGARDLEFIRATNSSGIFNAAARVVVGGVTGVGRFNSLAVIQGRPAIACFYNESGSDNSIVYYRASDANGASWGPRREAAPASQALGNERLLKLTEINGLPAILYFDTATGHVKFVRALNVDGTSWSAPSASFAATAGDCDLELINGRPTMLFHNNSQARIATALDANGSAWSSPVTPALGNLSPTLGGLLSIGTVPGVFYATAGINQTLRYVSPFAQQFILNWIAVEP